MDDLYDSIYDSDAYPIVYDQAFIFYDDDDDIDDDCEYEEIVSDLPAPNMPPAQA